jgi:hypothetical protein
MKEAIISLFCLILFATAEGCSGGEGEGEPDSGTIIKPKDQHGQQDARREEGTTQTGDAQPADLGPADSSTLPLDLLHDGLFPGDNQVRPEDLEEGDVPCVPGTVCYKKTYRIMGSMLVIIVDEAAYNPDWYLIDVLAPQGKTFNVRFKSQGLNQLKLVKAFLAPGGNPFISMKWVSPGYPDLMPVEIQPRQDAVAQIVYQPQGDPPPNPTVLTVWSSDPDFPVRTVTFKAKESGPDIELPLSAVNFGCGSYCFARAFAIENGGNKPLTIQSSKFEKASGEWSLQGTIAPGSTLPPKGQAGYQPIQFELNYCDADGNYTNDSNWYLIYSNDPDENPAKIHLNVMLPDQCPNR